jgi:exodeoxyribonuclease VII large subunit
VQLLEREGVLTRQRSLPMPLVPLRVALITSDGSAAAADFVHTLELSGRAFAVTLLDARVQGIEAEASLLAALEAADALPHPVDVVCIVRGGGARTDLAAFDRELVARAIAACAVPVLTGIGHEIDTTVADLVAHAAFKTPTACASALVDRVGEFRARVDDRAARVQRASRVALERSSARLARAAERTRNAGRTQLLAADARLDRAALRAGALDPAKVLARGWSITRTTDGALVRDAAGVAAGTALVTTLASGQLRSTADG